MPGLSWLRIAREVPMGYKFHLGLALFVLTITLLGGISYMDLLRIDNSIELLARIDQLNNAILEARRYEKNYLLNPSESAMEETSAYISAARVLISDLVKEGHKEFRRLGDLERLLDAYCRGLAKIRGQNVRGSDVESIRSTGKRMVDLAEVLSVAERGRIHELLRMLKLQLMASIAGVMLMGVAGTYFLFGRFFNALAIMEETTRYIGQGKLEPIPEPGRQPEVRRIARAFNQMVKELDSRQEQLLQARKLSSIGTLTAGIAHQLNNPLNNISTSCQIAQEELEEEYGETLSDFIRKMLRNIEQETVRAREIVHGLLEFTRQRSFAPRRISLAELIQKTMPLVSSQIPSGVELRVDVPSGIELQLDVQRMQEALLNLLINAIQAIPSEQGEIEVSAEREGDNAVLTIRDSGVGIPQRALDHIFDPFFTTKTDREGTGLGLSIVYGIIQQHGGKIRVQSEEGRGTRFDILLPIEPRESTA